MTCIYGRENEKDRFWGDIKSNFFADYVSIAIKEIGHCRRRRRRRRRGRHRHRRRCRHRRRQLKRSALASEMSLLCLLCDCSRILSGFHALNDADLTQK